MQLRQAALATLAVLAIPLAAAAQCGTAHAFDNYRTTIPWYGVGFSGGAGCGPATAIVHLHNPPGNPAATITATTDQQ